MVRRKHAKTPDFKMREKNPAFAVWKLELRNQNCSFVILFPIIIVLQLFSS